MLNSKKLDEVKELFDLANKEIGAYAVEGSWSYYDGLNFQCDSLKLNTYAKTNHIELEIKEGRVGIYIGKHWFFGD